MKGHHSLTCHTGPVVSCHRQRQVHLRMLAGSQSVVLAGLGLSTLPLW